MSEAQARGIEVGGYQKRWPLSCTLKAAKNDHVIRTLERGSGLNQITSKSFPNLSFSGFLPNKSSLATLPGPLTHTPLFHSTLSGGCKDIWHTISCQSKSWTVVWCSFSVFTVPQVEIAPELTVEAPSKASLSTGWQIRGNCLPTSTFLALLPDNFMSSGLGSAP